MTALVLFTRDLRVHDHPALGDAIRSTGAVIPLFVLDDEILHHGFATPNRISFLLDCLHDLRDQLRKRGADLVVGRGDPVAEAVRLASKHQADRIYVTADVSRYAQRRERRLAAACEHAHIELVRCPGTTVVPPQSLTPVGGDHYRVFTPYWRVWRTVPWRAVRTAPTRIAVPEGLDPGSIPKLASLAGDIPSPDLPAGGETEGRKLMQRWSRRSLPDYSEAHDDLAADETSRISPFLHFGCVSPLELATRFRSRLGGEAFVRQLCWRDFHHQVTAAFPTIATRDYRNRGDHWRRNARALEAWKSGRTGYPIVDAGMRQLQREGWMHNRARLITASFLTKDLRLDWRLGAQHFLDWLVDGDIANNSGNWQWVAGTGNDTRPHRMFNPIRQAERFDPDGQYVRRYVPELRTIAGRDVHRPWDLDSAVREQLEYPYPIVDHAEAVERFRAQRVADRESGAVQVSTSYPRGKET